MTDRSSPVRAVCVYCGSQPGRDPRFADAARSLGTALAAKGVALVYGGGQVGLMGIAADAVLAGGGHVVGVIPDFLCTAELLHPRLSEKVVVGSMHERKRIMFERSDAFLVLPGGFGTLDETLEMITWRQLGRHARPIVLVNVAGFFDPLVAHFERSIADGFVRPEYRSLYFVAPDVGNALHLAGV